MDRTQEIEIMKNSLTQSKLSQGMVWTDDRKRMLDRELTLIRIIGGYSPDIESLKEQDLLPDKLSARSVRYMPYKQIGNQIGINPISTNTYIVENPRKKCYLLPEVLGDDGWIHVWSTNGMSIGIVVARAKSPAFDEPGHITRSVLIDEGSEVNGNPLSYIYIGGEKRVHSTVISGEKTFIDVILGRFGYEYFNKCYNLRDVIPIVADQSKPSTGKPDLTLIVKGEISLSEEPLLISSRGLSEGKVIHTNIPLESMDFNASPNPLHTYMLKYVFDQGGK